MSIRTILVLAIIAMCFLSAADKPKDESCHLGSAHKCHCPRMVAREETKILAECKGTSAECVASVNPCEIVSRPDTYHPEDNCKVACKKDSCRCHDGPACTHFIYDYDTAPRENPQ